MVELVPHCFVLPLVGTRSVWTGIVPCCGLSTSRPRWDQIHSCARLSQRRIGRNEKGRKNSEERGTEREGTDSIAVIDLRLFLVCVMLTPLYAFLQQPWAHPNNPTPYRMTAQISTASFSRALSDSCPATGAVAHLAHSVCRFLQSPLTAFLSILRQLAPTLQWQSGI